MVALAAVRDLPSTHAGGQDDVSSEQTPPNHEVRNTRKQGEDHRRFSYGMQDTGHAEDTGHATWRRDLSVTSFGLGI